MNPTIVKADFELSNSITKKEVNPKTTKKITLSSPDEIPQEVFSKTNSYYAAIESMKSTESSYKNNPQFKNFYYDLYSTSLANAGRYKNHIQSNFY